MQFTTLYVIGNADTLKHSPATKGIDVYGRLRNFFNRNYSAQYMTLAVHSRRKLILCLINLSAIFLNKETTKKPFLYAVYFILIILHSEQPTFYGVLAVLSLNTIEFWLF